MTFLHKTYSLQKKCIDTKEGLDLVQDYLSHNRQFDLDDIIPYINFRLRRTSNKLNYQGIKSILHSLVKKKFLIEGSKLTSEDVLDNKTRKIIFEYMAITIVRFPS